MQRCLWIVRAGRDFPAEECWCSYPKATVEEQQQKKPYPYTNGCLRHTGFLGVRCDCVSIQEPTSPARWNGSESSTVVATMLDSAGAGQEIMRPNLTAKLPERSSSTNGSSGGNWITKQLAEHRGKNYKRNDAIKFGKKCGKWSVYTFGGIFQPVPAFPLSSRCRIFCVTATCAEKRFRNLVLTGLHRR